MNQKLLDLLQVEENVKELLAEGSKAVTESPKNPENAINRMQNFCISKGIKDCSTEDIRELITVVKATTENIKSVKGGKTNEITDEEIDKVVGGRHKSDYDNGYQDFDYEGEEKYWKKIISHIALCTTAAVSVSALAIGGTVAGVHYFKNKNQ